MGWLDAVRVTQLGGESYVELRRAAAPVVTLLVHYAQPEEHRDELKRQLEACLFALSSLLAEPTVLPGGGCLETVLLHHLRRHARGSDRVTRQVAEAMSNVLRQNALSISGRAALWSDAIYRHAWEAEPRDDSLDGSCVCGLVQVRDLRGSLDCSELTSSYCCEAEAGGDVELGGDVGGEPAALDAREVCEESLVDCARVKTSALEIALEACYAILGIGTCVYEKRETS